MLSHNELEYKVICYAKQQFYAILCISHLPRSRSFCNFCHIASVYFVQSLVHFQFSKLQLSCLLVIFPREKIVTQFLFFSATSKQLFLSNLEFTMYLLSTKGYISPLSSESDVDVEPRINKAILNVAVMKLGSQYPHGLCNEYTQR